MIKESAAELASVPRSSVWEAAMDLLVREREASSSLTGSFGQTIRPVQTLPLSKTTSFDPGFQPAVPAPDMPDMSAIQQAVEHDASNLVILKQNETLTPQANSDTIEKGIRDAQSMAQDAKVELAKFDKIAAAGSIGPDGNKPGLARTIATNTVGGVVTGSLVNFGFTAAGIANPMTGPVVAACTVLKTGTDIAAAAMGRGSYGDTTPTQEFRSGKTGRGRESSYGYGRSENAPATDDFNRMMSNIPGAPKPGRELLTRADIAGSAMADQEIKLGPEALARMEKSINQLSLKAETAATAFETRRDRGATVAISDGAEAVLTRKLNPNSTDIKVADNRQMVQIFGNLA